MKNKLLILLLTATGTLAASAQLQVRLSARTTATARDTEQLWKTDYGSYNRDVYQIRSVTASFECTKGEGPATLICQWIGRDKAANSAAVLISRQEFPLTLKKGQTTTQEIHEVFAESDDKYKALATRTREGTRFGGWIIRLLDPTGKTLAEQSSSTPLLKKFPADAKTAEKTP